jgi:Tol biopolymer transport system component
MTFFLPRIAGRSYLRFAHLLLLCSIVLVPLALPGCGDDATTNPTTDGGHTGTLYYETVGSGAYRYSFSTEFESALFEARNPSLLPSGEMVVLDQWAQIIQIVGASGATRTDIYTAPYIYRVFEPKASPDGSRIAFSYQEDSQHIRTVVITRAGAPVAEFDNLGSPFWMPDGRLVMSGSWRYPYEIAPTTITPGGNASIFISDAGLTSATPVGTPLDKPLTPAVSPDGARIAFELAGHIWTMNIDGSGLEQITTGNKRENTPAWSPDGKHIVCICFGTFEVSYYNAIAIVPSNPSAPTDMANDNAAIWPRNKSELSLSAKGRLNATDYVTWK